MEINNLEKNNNIELDNNLTNNNLQEMQQNFLDSTLGKVVNTAVDIGIRALLPDFIDEQVINIKDNLFEYGLKDGIKKTIDDALDLGKSAIGIFTGNFENINQMQNAVQTGGLIDGISGLLDTVVDKVRQSGLINGTIANTIKQGKNVILNNVQSNIEKTFMNQLNSVENIDNYINTWKTNFENKNFEGMENAYQNIEKELKELVPLEKTINDARIIGNLHNLIKNNGQDFNLSREQLELAQKLI